MTTVNDLVALARAQVGSPGSVENPIGSNRGTKYHKWYGSFSEGWEWCAIFVDYVYFHVDPALIHSLKSAYSGDYLATGRRYGEEVSSPSPGCMAIMDYNLDDFTDHIGIVVAVDGDEMTLVEGNHNNRVELPRHRLVTYSTMAGKFNAVLLCQTEIQHRGG